MSPFSDLCQHFTEQIVVNRKRESESERERVRERERKQSMKVGVDGDGFSRGQPSVLCCSAADYPPDFVISML